MNEQFNDMDIKACMKEAEVTAKSEQLRDFGAAIDEIKLCRRSHEDIGVIIDTVEKWLKDCRLNTFDRLMAYHVLGHAYCAQKYMQVAPSEASYNNPIVLKEVYCYRITLSIADEIKKKKFWMLYQTAVGCAYQAQVHLGNVYDHIGRHQDAQYSYLCAAQMMPSDYMWKFNVGFSLGGMFGYYENRVTPFVVEQAKALLKPYLDKPETTSSAKQMWERISPLKTWPLSDDREYEYR